MAKTSSTGGIIPQLSSSSLYDDDLTDFFQSWVSRLTGIEGARVRPRWQQEPSNIPSEGTNWCAIGLIDFSQNISFFDQGQTEANKTVAIIEEFTALASFYGPKADTYATLFSAGVIMAQNRELLDYANISIVTIGSKSVVPEFIKQRWVKRVDFRLGMSRTTKATYPVMAIASAEATLNTTTIEVKK
jgi:hypothetical protein